MGFWGVVCCCLLPSMSPSTLVPTFVMVRARGAGIGNLLRCGTLMFLFCLLYVYSKSDRSSLGRCNDVTQLHSEFWRWKRIRANALLCGVLGMAFLLSCFCY